MTVHQNNEMASAICLPHKVKHTLKSKKPWALLEHTVSTILKFFRWYKTIVPSSIMIKHNHKAQSNWWEPKNKIACIALFIMRLQCTRINGLWLTFIVASSQLNIDRAFKYACVCASLLLSALWTRYRVCRSTALGAPHICYSLEHFEILSINIH